MAFPLLEVFNIGAKLIDRLLPNPEAKAAAQLELMKLQQSGELAALTAETELAKGQLEINKTEAASSSLFVSGWRPFIGWVCGGIFFANYVGVPLLAWLSGIWAIPAPPRLDIGEVLPVLLGLLGLGGLRTAEKIKGVG